MKQVCCFVKVIKLRNSVAKILRDSFQRNQLCHVSHKTAHLVRQAEIAFFLPFVSSCHTVCLCDHFAQLRRQLCKGVANLVKLRSKGSESSRNFIAGIRESIEVSCFQLFGQVRDFPDGVDRAADRLQPGSVQNGQGSHCVCQFSNAAGHGVEVHAIQAGHGSRDFLDGVDNAVDAFHTAGKICVADAIQKIRDVVQPRQTNRRLFQRRNGSGQLVKAVHNFCDVALCP